MKNSFNKSLLGYENLYKEPKINAELKCPICRSKYVEPRALSCQEIIFDTCDLIIRLNSESLTGFFKIRTLIGVSFRANKGFPDK